MSRLTTIRRRLMCGAGIVLVLSGLILYIAHTGPVRRFALAQIQNFVRNTQGLVLEIGALDYNLLSSRFELKQVAVRGVASVGLPAPVTAQRIVVSIPLWRIVMASFETSQIRIDGLGVHWIIAADGRSNWPLSNRPNKELSRGPTVSVTSAELDVQDHRTGFSLHLPDGRLFMAWNPVKNEYGIALRNYGGQLYWNDVHVALNRLQIRAAVASSGVFIHSLELISGTSRAEVTASLSDALAQVDGQGRLDIDLNELSRALGFSTPARGRLQVAVSATGAMKALQLAGRLSGDAILVGGTPISRIAAEALLDTATGELQVRSVSAEVFSGRLIGNAKVATGDNGGRSEFAARLAGLDAAQVARAFGATIPYAGRLTVEGRGFWPGLNWRRAVVAAVARSRTAAGKFKIACDRDSVRTSLDASLGDGAAATRGDVAVRFSDQALTGQLTGNVVSLARLSRDLEGLLDHPSGSLTRVAVDGSAHWSATLKGQVRHPSAAVQAEINGLSIGALKDANVRVDADFALNRTEIRSARVVWGGQEIELKGQIGDISTDAPLQLEGNIEGQSLGSVMENLGFAHVAQASVSGTVRISGSVGSPAVETRLNLGGLTAFGQRFTRTTLDASWRNTELTVSKFRAEQNPESPGRLDASGSLDIATGSYSFNIEGHNLRPDLTRPPSGLKAEGTFEVESHGKGTLQDPAFSARIAGRDIQITGIAVGELQAEVEARDHRAIVLVTAPALNAKASSTVAMQGDWRFDLTLDTENTRLNTTPPSSFDASVRGSGLLAQPRIERVTAAIRNLRVTGSPQEIVSDGPVELSYADGRLQVNRLVLNSGESRVRLTGGIPVDEGGGDGALSLEGRVLLDQFSHLLPGVDASNTGGVVLVSATLTGNVQHWTPAGSITIHDGRFRWQSFPFGVENVSGRLDVENGIVRTDQISGNVGGGKLRIDGSLPLRLLSNALPAAPRHPEQPARFSAQLDNLQLSGGKGDSAATVTIGVKITGQASALNFDALEASAVFSELHVAGRTSDVRQIAPTRITIAGGMARLESLDAKGANSSLKASGSIGLKGEYPLQVDLVGETNLEILAAVASPLEAAGAVRLEAHVGGTLSEPKMTGFVVLDRATLAFPEPRLQAADVTLNATLAGDEIQLRDFKGTLNGGGFTGGGDLRLRGAKIPNANLFLRGKDVFLEYPAGVKTTSSLDLKLISRGNRMTLEGQVEVQEGYYDASLELFGPKQALNRLPISTPASAASALALDLRLITKRPVEMDNNLGRLGATADLRMAGPANALRLVGTLQLEQDGKLYFGDRTYYIERGAVRFLDAPKITPELDIHAYTRTGDYTVKLGLTGEPKELTTTLTSDPPLSRDDIIAVLVTGKTLAENHGVDVRSLEAFALATGAMNAAVSSRLHRTLGVSRVSIQPGAVAAESNPGTRITITQDFTRTLRLMYSMNLSDSNDQIWVTEYDVSRRFTTRAVKQSDNTYRGEFRHDIRFGGPSAEESGTAQIRMAKISKVEFTGADPFSPLDLAKRFKVKPGQKANPMKLRRGSESLTKFLIKKGYLESRLRVDRVDDGQNLSLTVRIELGPTVEMTYQGAGLPRKQKARVRNVWHTGISDQQRPNAAKSVILDYFAQKGYLQAQVTPEVINQGDHKLVRFDLRPGTRYRNVKIEIEGAASDRARDILALLRQDELRLAIYRNHSRVSEALTEYYEQRGYLAVKVSPLVHELNAERRTGRVVIPVDEGPVFRVGAVEFSGNTALSPANLREGLPLEAGSVFEPGRLDPSLAALKLKYGRLGYRDADVDYKIARHDERASVDVFFTVVDNKQTWIGAVDVEGNRRTSADFVRRQLRVSSGEVADTTLIRDSNRNLTQTGAYASSDIQLQPQVQSGASDKHTQVADLLVAVAEPKPYRLLYGGLYDSGGGPGFISDFQNLNSLGPGRTLGLRARVDPKTDDVRLYVTQPFWRQLRMSTTIATYFTRETKNYQTTPTETLGMSIQQDLPLRSKWLLSYGYRFERQRGFVPDPAAPDITADVVSVAPLTLTISRDARDSFLDATKGSFISHGFEFAPKFLGSDYPYARYYVQYFKYFPLTRPRAVPYGEQPQRSRLVFATGSRLGLQKGFSAEGAVLTNRFYAGGGTTVRGFKQDELGPKLENGQPAGGNAVLVLNEELRYPLYKFFDAVTFVDIGNVFPRVSDFRLSDLRMAGGFGLRIRNPFVVLRFDYGFKFDRRPGEKPGAFFFSIGQAF